MDIINDENIEIDLFREVQYFNSIYSTNSFFCYCDNDLYRVHFRYELDKNSFSVFFGQGDKDITLPFPLKSKTIKQINKNLVKMLTRFVGV